MPEMPRRSIRIDDVSWEQAKELARQATATGVSVSAWIRDAIATAYDDRNRPNKPRKQ